MGSGVEEMELAPAEVLSMINELEKPPNDDISDVGTEEEVSTAVGLPVAKEPEISPDDDAL